MFSFYLVARVYVPLQPSFSHDGVVTQHNTLRLLCVSSTGHLHEQYQQLTVQHTVSGTVLSRHATLVQGYLWLASYCT